MRVMANEWANSGVTVNALAPVTSKAAQAEHLKKPACGRTRSAGAGGRLGVVEDVSAPRSSLLTPRSIRHRHIMYVDGGRTLI